MRLDNHGDTPTLRRLNREIAAAMSASLDASVEARGTHGRWFTDHGAAWERARELTAQFVDEVDRRRRWRRKRTRRTYTPPTLDDYTCDDYTEQRDARAERYENEEIEFCRRVGATWR